MKSQHSQLEGFSEIFIQGHFVKNKVTVVAVVCAVVIMTSIMNIVVLIYFSLLRVMPYFIRIYYFCV